MAVGIPSGAQTIFDPDEMSRFIKGDKGEKGEKGETGDKGDKGDQGEKGDRGERGERGEKGDQGERGERGLQGERGLPGEKGDKGDRGEQGSQGERGLKGDKGEDGKDGSPVLAQSIFYLSERELSLHFRKTSLAHTIYFLCKEKQQGQLETDTFMVNKKDYTIDRNEIGRIELSHIGENIKITSKNKSGNVYQVYVIGFPI
jgi:hypothetical protein